MAPSSVRALHFVLKVAERTATVHFLHEVSWLFAGLGVDGEVWL